MKRGKKQRERRRGEEPELEMTPMIDVVFLLLIFFIVTLKPENILSHLDVSAPMADPDATPEEKVDDLVNIVVYKDGFVLKGRKCTIGEVERTLTELASYSKEMPVIIRCTGDSRHSSLIQLLDVCSKAGLTQLSVFSM